MKQTNTTGHLFIGNVSQHRVELNVILSLLLLFHRGKNGDRNNKQIRGEEKLSYVVSRFAYFHHNFQSHAEYLDYLNRLFAHFFPRLRRRPFVESLIFFHSFVYSFAIRLLFVCYSISVDEKQNLKNRYKLHKWHTNVSLLKQMDTYGGMTVCCCAQPNRTILWFTVEISTVVYTLLAIISYRSRYAY